MTTVYANVCDLRSTAEAVVALFGMDSQLTRRIVISPAMAKRLARLLARVVSDYERQFGELRLSEAS